MTDVMVEVFSLILGMSIPWCGKIGKGKFPGFERKLTSKLSWGKFHILGRVGDKG